MNREIDVVVIGAGIAGITAGIYLKRSSISSVLIEKGAPGGKLNNIHKIENYPAIPSISGPDLAFTLFSQANSLGVEIAYGSVIEVKKEEGRFLVKTDAGDYSCKALIIATGVENKKLGIPGEKEFNGKGVSYCATCDGPFFKGKPVAVIGNKDHAVEDVLYLSNIASKVYFVVPEPLETTEAHHELLLQCENVEILNEVQPLEIIGKEHVEKLKIDSSTINEIEVDAVFALYGEKSSSQFLASLNPKSNKGFLVVDASMATSVEGLFACGDIIDKKLRQLVNAAGEAAVAATSAIAYCRSIK